ncbi:MAG TPA: glycoside hydrolase family 2, partial [Thiothrix sp.]|nr:glycoside hydrolase family 2 [Thiothrix sp.]
ANHSWQKIKVPANWYKEGYDIYGKAIYKRHFFLADQHKHKRITLVFHGVDYFTEVWVNGKKVGKHEGYFQRFYFDISHAVNFNKSNEIIVHVDSPYEKPEDFSLNKRLIKGIFSHHDTRPGGAWSDRGQEKNTGGIWDSVELHLSQKIYAAHLSATPEKINETQWQINTKLELEGNYPKATTFHWSLKPKNHSSPTLTGISTSPDFNISVKNPALWWPIGFGKPNLYELNVNIFDQGQLLDRIKTTTAFRHIELSKNKVWKINGKRILLRGTNYIASQWLSEMNRSKFTHDINLMKQANINTIRVHAHITAPEFYQLCDEQGLMIWQDFPLQWGYQDSPILHQQATSQLKDMLKQLGHHPSIIHWTLHNEPPWDADWMKWKYPNYNPSQNKILDKKLLKAAESYEKYRPISMYSATKEHPWLGWYSGHWLDYAKPTDQAFIAEFGAQALPSKAALHHILGGDIDLPEVSEKEQKQQWQSWKKWQYHNFQPRESFEIAKIKAGQTVDSLIENTQVYQAQLTQLAAESYRRQAYQPVTALFQFMFVENWESMNWGILDYWRNKKPAYYRLQQAFQPILPSIEWSAIEYPIGSIKLGLWALNDTPHTYPQASYQLTLKHDDKLFNTVVDQQQYSINLTADLHKKIHDYQTPKLSVGHYVLSTKLINNSGKALGTNHYHFTVK